MLHLGKEKDAVFYNEDWIGRRRIASRGISFKRFAKGMFEGMCRTKTGGGAKMERGCWRTQTAVDRVGGLVLLGGHRCACLIDLS